MPDFLGVGAQVTGLNVLNLLNPPLPSGIQQNDTLYVFCVARFGGSRTFSSPGYNSLGNVYVDVAGADLSIEVLRKIAGASESSPTVTCSGASSGDNGWSAQMMATRNGDLSTPEDAASILDSSGASTTFTPNGITTVTDNALAISFVATSDDNSLAIQTAQGFTARMSGSAYDTIVGNDHAVGVATKAISNPGVVTNPTWQQTVNGPDFWGSITIAARHATGGAVEKTASDSFLLSDSGAVGTPIAASDSFALSESPTISALINVGYTDVYDDIYGNGPPMDIVSFTDTAILTEAEKIASDLFTFTDVGVPSELTIDVNDLFTLSELGLVVTEEKIASDTFTLLETSDVDDTNRFATDSFALSESATIFIQDETVKLLVIG